MSLARTDEQQDLGRVARDLFQARSPESEVRRLMRTVDGFDPALWGELADLGLTGLAVPTEYGGAGAGLVEVGVALEEAGRSLLCAPYLSTVVLATTALLAAGAAGDKEAAAAYLPGIAAGSLRATVAHAPGDVDVSRDGRLSGTVSHVLDGATADLLLVPAGTGLYAVDADASGLTRTPLATLDLTRKQALLAFDRTPAVPVGEPGAGAEVLRQVHDAAVAALACEQAGGTRQVLDMTVAYARTRVQFGRPIGQFQAVKHRCAEMLVLAESARSAAHRAIADVAAGADRPESVPVAGAYCGEAFQTCAAEAIQLHGGIGFTWEHPAQLYFKRARTDALLFGDARTHRAALAQRLTAG